ncbi:MAG: hypothetical protein R3C52_02795 [Hyphomonadaceae bacterium]
MAREVIARLFGAAIGLVLAAIFGCALATILGVAIAVAVSSADGYTPSALLPLLVGAFGVGALKGAFAGGPVALLAGLPIHVVLVSTRMNRFWVYALVGALLATLTSVIAVLIEKQTISPALVTFDALAGMVAGLLFYLFQRGR